MNTPKDKQDNKRLTKPNFIHLNFLPMKNILRLFVVLLMASSGSLWAQYGIGTNNPNASAALEIVSPDKGVLIPSVSLTSTSTFAPITGTSSTTHNGMIVWNESTSTANGLTGVGFYFWENDASTAGTGNWYRLTTTGDEVIPTGTVTNSTLRWDGSNWVETTTLLTADTAGGTATLAANTTVTGTLAVSGNTTVTGALVVENNATVTGTLEVTGNTTVTGDFSVQGTSTLASTTLGAVVYDYDGDAGTDGQILSTTGTRTDWIDNTTPTSGTVTNSTLRWNGSAWVETTTLLTADTAGGTATLAANTTVTGTLEVSENATITGALVVENNATVTGTLAVSGNTTVTGALVVENNATVTGTLEVTGNATVTGDDFVEGSATVSGTLTAQSTTSLEGALLDSFGNTGTAGQILSSTGTATQWVDANTATFATMTATGNVTSTVSLLFIEPGGADVDATLAAASSVSVGFELKIRRNQGYTGTNDLIQLDVTGEEPLMAKRPRTSMWAISR